MISIDITQTYLCSESNICTCTTDDEKNYCDKWYNVRLICKPMNIEFSIDDNMFYSRTDHQIQFQVNNVNGPQSFIKFMAQNNVVTLISSFELGKTETKINITDNEMNTLHKCMTKLELEKNIKLKKPF